MFAINEQISQFSVNSFENTLRVAQITLDTSERLLKHQFELSKQALESNVQAARELAGATDPQQALTQFNKLVTQAYEQMLGNSRALYDIVVQSQGELGALAEENLGKLNQSVQAGLEELAQQAPQGSDAAVNAIKSSFAAAAATVNSMTRAAQQAAEMVDASIKASTPEPAKTSGRRSNSSQTRA